MKKSKSKGGRSVVTQGNKDSLKRVIARGISCMYKYPIESATELVNTSSFAMVLDTAPEKEAEIMFHYSVDYWINDIITEKAIEDVLQKFNPKKFSVSCAEEKFEVKSSEETILKAYVYRGIHTFQVLKEGEQKGIKNIMLIYPDNRITQTFKMGKSGTYHEVDFCKIDELKMDFINP